MRQEETDKQEQSEGEIREKNQKKNDIRDSNGAKNIKGDKKKTSTKMMTRMKPAYRAERRQIQVNRTVIIL